MPFWKIRILDSSYSTKGNILTNEIYGRTDDGQSITVLYTGFEPYFYVVEPNPSVIETLESDSRVVRLEDRRLEVHGRKKRCKRVVVDYPWSVKSIRNQLSGRVKVLAADILFAHRFLYDMDIGACVGVEGEEVNRSDYTTDIVVKANSPDAFSEIEDFKPELKILSFDIENSIRTEKLLTIGVVLEYRDAHRTYHFEGDEKEMITALTSLIREEDPDVITGYNIDGYDIPHLIKRWKALSDGGGKNENGLFWGRDGSDIRDSSGRMWHVTGRIVADAWLHVRKEFHPKQETLNHVSKILLGEEKLDVISSEMDREWSDNREKVIRYCIKDADLALRLLKKTAALNKYMDLATVSKLPLDAAMNAGSSTLIDSLLIRMADRRGVGVPINKFGSKQKAGKIKGGYVHAINPGLYHWVCVLDFKSMYPSLMIAKNICFTTLVDDENAEEKNYIVSPTGIKFLPKEEKLGLIPELLQKLMDERDETKAKMREAEREGKKEMYWYYNGLQAAIKVLMNSFYGVFASSFYRFTDRRIGESITAFARESTKHIITTLEKEGVQVVYGDTDSVFFVSPFKNLEETLTFGKDVAERFSREGAVLEFEKVLEPLFSHGKKKRYVGKIVWPTEDIIIRGYEIRRTDSFELQSRILMGVFERILDEDTEGAVNYAREAVEKILKGDVRLEDLVISRTCKPFEQYDRPESQPTVQAAKKMIQRGYEFIPNMKVSWIVTNGSVSPQVVEPYISGVPFEKKPDYMYYAKRVASNVGRVTEVFGWDERRLLSGISQKTLFSEVFESAQSDEDGKNGKESRVHPPVSTKLEDFL